LLSDNSEPGDTVAAFTGKVFYLGGEEELIMIDFDEILEELKQEVAKRNK